MFCKNCGSQIEEGERFCKECGTPVGTGIIPAKPVLTDPAPMETVEKTEKSKVPVILGSVFVLILFAVLLVVVGYDLVKTNAFRENMAVFEKVPTEFEGLGKYKEEFDSLLDEAQDASSHFMFWRYEDLTERMDALSAEIRQMNKAVAEYREVYEEVVRQIETDGQYLLDERETDYQNTKADLEDALSNFDEKNAKKRAEEFAGIRDDIVRDNEVKASTYISDAQNIKNSFNSNNAHPFELYMIGDFIGKIEADNAGHNYKQLNEDYAQLKEWSDKFYAATGAREQIGSFVQADVSESDRVKLYLSSYDYDQYDFKLEDFIIYEKNGEVWDACEAVSMDQIRGALTMDLVVDISGSMENNFYTMQSAVEGFVNSTHADTTLGLSTIGSIYERYEEFTSDKSAIIDAAWGLECYGLTSLYQSLYSSVIYTASAEGARCVVAFTDGINEPYGSGYDYDAQDVIDVSNYYQVPVYIIGIGSSVRSNELREIADATGGAYYDRVSIYDLQNLYSEIYAAQGRLYELAYKTVVPNHTNRDIYVLYSDDTSNLSVRLESQLNAEALQEAYESAGFSSGDLSGFYTDSKYLSSDDLSKLGDDLEAVQTVINIYYAKHGFQFGDGENGQKQLAKMISLGVISENGTLGGDEVTAILKANPVLYQNFSALYNYRYELVYTVARDIYWNNPSISYEELRSQVHAHYGEENEMRFDPVVNAAWKAIQDA